LTYYHMYTTGLQNVLEAARGFGIKRVSLGSSGSVYGGIPEGPYREDMPLPVESRTQVEAFKKSMEIQGFHYADRADLNVLSLRIGSVYGPMYYSIFNAASRMCHGSAFMVGVASAARMAPFFFLGALSGVVADWVDRRALLQFITLGRSLVAGLMAP